MRLRIARNVRLWVREARPTLALALPIMAGMVGQMLMGLTDTIMVGRVGVVTLALGLAWQFHLQDGPSPPVFIEW